MLASSNMSHGTTTSRSPQKVPVSVYHACFLTEACKDHLIQVNGLLHALNCTVGLEPTPVKEEIFNTRPTVTFDAAERTEVKALLSKSAFSVRMTTTKARHFDLRAKVPFCDFSLEYEALDGSLSEGHEVTASVAVMRNMYHARVSIQAGFKHLSAKFIEDIDHALVTGVTKEQKVAALTKVFNRYGHLWCSKVFLGGKLYTYQSNVHVDANQVEHFKSELQAQFASKIYTTGDPVRVEKEHDSHSPDSTNEHAGGVSVKGGNEQVEMSTGKWMDSVRDWRAWRVIEYAEVQPVYTLLDQGRCDIITDLLAAPEAPEPNYIPITTTLHIINHQGNNMSYPISIIHEQAKMTCLEDDEPHKGDGLHVLVFPEPGKYDYNVYQADTNGVQGVQFRDFVRGLKPFTLVIAIETWSIGTRPKPQSLTAREAIIEGLRILGLDDNYDMQARLGTDNSWIFIGYKDIEASKAVVLSRANLIYLTISSVGGRFATVGLDDTKNPKTLVEFPAPEYQHKYLAKHGWVTTTMRTKTTTLIDHVEKKKVFVRKVSVTEEERSL